MAVPCVQWTSKKKKKKVKDVPKVTPLVRGGHLWLCRTPITRP